MRYNRKRLIRALQEDGVELTESQLANLDKLFVFMAEQLVKIYFQLKKNDKWMKAILRKQK